MDLQWVMLIPLITVSVTLLPAGRIGDVIGHRKVYLAGLLLLVVGTAGCALAMSFSILLAARGVQGVGASFLMAASPALVSLLASPGRRGRDLGIISTATYMGLTLGPPLGGLLETFGSFRFVFLFQVPLVAALLAWTVFRMPDAEPRGRSRGIDLPGALLLGTALTALFLVLARGGSWPLVPRLVVAIVGGFAAVAFVVWERRSDSPMVDVSLLKTAAFLLPAIAAFLQYQAIFHATFLMPFLLVDLRGLSTAQAGIVLTAMPLVMALSTGSSGALSDRIGTRTPAAFGLGLTTFALLGLAAITLDIPLACIILLLGILGLGTGIFVSPNTSALMSAAPRERQGTAAGVMALARNLGMLSGTSISAVLYTHGRLAAVARGVANSEAGMEGMSLAFLAGAMLAGLACVVTLVRRRSEIR
jgi:EmrB/QacA subfamily drug resistance transporter